MVLINTGENVQSSSWLFVKKSVFKSLVYYDNPMNIYYQNGVAYLLGNIIYIYVPPGTAQ
jgi:hypothetical protein